MVQLKPLAPCIVLGLETQIALGIVRELGRAGVPVIGIAQTKVAIGLKSRYLVKSFIADKPRSDELLARIRKLGEQYEQICLLAVSEVNLTWLLENRSNLGRVLPILPNSDAISIVLDKQKTLAIAQTIGLNIPRTIEPISLDDVETTVKDLSFPVVLKWKDPSAVGSLLSENGIPLHKAEYAMNSDALLAICKRYLPVGRWPLIQEYCPGVGLGQFFYMHNGQALRRFQHLRIAEWPPEGGFSSVCDSVPLSEHVALQEQSISLLREIGWEGVAMVEYRFDPISERAVLMEINGRFWGSFPLAVHCQVGFALLAYQIQGGGQCDLLNPLRDGIRCRMVVTELKRLFRITFRPDKIQDPHFKVEPWRELKRFIKDFFSPGVRYYIWSNDDPGPFWADLLNMILRRS